MHLNAEIQPDYPGQFTSPEHARQWCSDYYHWANMEHHHSGLNGYTPVQVFTGSYKQVAITKQQALDKCYELNPQRFVRGRPIIKLPPTVVSINPITEQDIKDGTLDAVNFPTLSKAGYVKSTT